MRLQNCDELHAGSFKGFLMTAVFPYC